MQVRSRLQGLPLPDPTISSPGFNTAGLLSQWSWSLFLLPISLLPLIFLQLVCYLCCTVSASFLPSFRLREVLIKWWGGEGRGDADTKITAQLGMCRGRSSGKDREAYRAHHVGQ